MTNMEHSRRQLLAMLAAAGTSASATVLQEPALKAAKIDHVSIQVTDLPKSIAFYRDIFGLTILGEDKPNEIVRMGVACFGITDAHRLAGSNTVGQAVALIDIEDSVFPEHRNEPRVRFVAIPVLHV